MAEIKAVANAKINIYLDVLGKRPDGYHNIKTVFQEVSLADTLFISELKTGIKVSCSNPNIPSDERNLAYKAAAVLREFAGINAGAEIKIVKNIPAGAGLGGGSSDAAAVLQALNKLWKLKIPKHSLAELGKKIGADVPFFIYGKRCMAEGIGDILTPLPSEKKEWYVIVYPGFEISSELVYTRLTSNKKRCIIKNYYNRLEEVVIPIYPEILKIKDKLSASGAQIALMSGSGSSVFGLVNDAASGETVASTMKNIGYKYTWVVHSIQ